MGLIGQRFASVDKIQQNATAGLRIIPAQDFQRCFQQLRDLWIKCVRAEVRYFEVDYLSFFT
jgi:hypothetical protein